MKIQLVTKRAIISLCRNIIGVAIVSNEMVAGLGNSASGVRSSNAQPFMFSGSMSS